MIWVFQGIPGFCAKRRTAINIFTKTISMCNWAAEEDPVDLLCSLSDEDPSVVLGGKARTIAVDPEERAPPLMFILFSSAGMTDMKTVGTCGPGDTPEQCLGFLRAPWVPQLQPMKLITPLPTKHPGH